MTTSLKMTTITKNEVDYQELNSFISDHYDQPFDFVADQECYNDTAHNVTVKKDQNKSEYNKNQLAAFKAGEPTTSYMAGTLMDDLCDQDLIPAGGYLISVYW